MSWKTVREVLRGGLPFAFVVKVHNTAWQRIKAEQPLADGRDAAILKEVLADAGGFQR